MPVPFIRPVMPRFDEMAEDLRSIIESNWFSNFGPKERQFRQQIEEYVGGGVYAVTTNNATSALMAALAALLPRGTGRESVAIVSFTFAAGAQAILWHGYRPAWFDIDDHSLQPSLSSFEELISVDPSVRCILLTNTFGIGNSQINEWEMVAAKYGLPLIIDSAAGFGSTYLEDENLGRRGDCEIFSFHATKPFAIGEGGAITSRDQELAERMRQFTNFGFASAAGAENIGLNGKLQELSAAIGIRQLVGFEALLMERRRVLDKYGSAFAGLPVRFPEGISDSSVCFASLVFEDLASREAVHSSLCKAEVDVRKYYSPAVHAQPIFKSYVPSLRLEHTLSMAERILSLPVIPGMSDDEIGLVCGAIAKCF